MLILIKKNLLLSISLVFIYFVFNLLGGERGLISWYKKSRILNDLENKNNVLTSKIENLDLKKRPVSAVADNTEVRNASIIKIKIKKNIVFKVLYNKKFGLKEKNLKEHFKF